MTHRGYRNGLKTAVLLGGLWALLAAVGWIIANSTGRSIWLWVFAALGLFQTAYAYWNSASMSLRA
ncbi:MAG: protease HtpX, partial [Schaalia hyovaginalis]|nr:protease HtpX [Schaalia hyovaginalis]